MNAATRLALAAVAVCTRAASAFTLSIGVGFDVSVKLRSMEEIMANMTPASALRTVLDMERVQKSPEMVALLTSRLESNASAKGVALRGHARDPAAAYASLKQATDMLNEMIDEARMKLDVSQEKCTQFERNQMLMLEEAQRDVASFNGQAAEARGHVLDAQAWINMLQNKIPQIQGELDEHRRTCSRELGILEYQLSILKADLGVVEQILNMTKCDSPASATPPSLLQAFNLVDCAHCGRGGVIMIQHNTLQPLLDQLKSDAARGYLQQNLHSAFHEEALPAVALTQEQVRHQRRISEVRNSSDSSNLSSGVYQEPPPVPPARVDCIPTTKCTLKPSSCIRLREKFERVQGGMLDKLKELSDQIVNLERYCEETDRSLSGQLATMAIQLAEHQANLALATKQQVESESQAMQKGRQHADLKAEYTETLTKCCDEQNIERSEMCALRQIRGELFKVQGTPIFIKDCEVGPWTEQECSVSCGGGIRKKMRDVVTDKTIGGADCPPLTEEEPCNEQPCPVDCILDDWSEWSACSAECGGGVLQRTRGVRLPMAHDGEPCGQTDESAPCNIESCDADCVLSDWSDWSTCNKACGGGHRGHLKTIAEPARGTGTCPEENDPLRLGFEACNSMTCASLLPADRVTLNCMTKSDIVILLDSSGSLGSGGWMLSKLMAIQLAKDFQAQPAANVSVALYVFSSSTSQWITHLSEGTTPTDVATKTRWLAGGTYTHQALSEAGNEFMNGRDDAQSVVVVITDGFPFSQTMTEDAAKRLETKARILWVAVGANAPVDLIKKMASAPVEDHMISVASWNDFLTVNTVNKILAATCPQVK